MMKVLQSYLQFVRMFVPCSFLKREKPHFKCERRTMHGKKFASTRAISSRIEARPSRALVPPVHEPVRQFRRLRANCLGMFDAIRAFNSYVEPFVDKSKNIGYIDL